MRPRLLDLFCGAGGAAMGYWRAGFDVTGVDRFAQPGYPFEFHCADALEFPLDGFDAIHASPPCVDHSPLSMSAYPTGTGRLLADIRHRLHELRVPSVIENVPGEHIRRDVMLCGEMFGLGVIRHRWFEMHGWTCEQPVHVPHRGRVAGYRGGRHDGPYVGVHGYGYGKDTLAKWSAAMGIDWMRKSELAQAIPPAYTNWIGERLGVSVERN